MPEKPLRIAVSGRCLFSMDNEDELFHTAGLDVYISEQIAKKHIPLTSGPAFPLLKRLLDLNSEEETLIEAVIVSGQHPFAGMRMLHSAAEAGMKINKAFFTGGSPSYPYLRACYADLFLTRNTEDAQKSMDEGTAAAVLSPMPQVWTERDGPVLVALDGDAVIFSDACETVAKRDGLQAFYRRQSDNMDIPLSDGPFAGLLRKLDVIRSRRPGCIRLCLVTARDGVAMDRAMMTLLKWGIQPDEAFFLGNLGKGEVIRTLRPHIFLDDAEHHIRDTEIHAPAGRVPYLSAGDMLPFLQSALAKK